ncbi:MAG: hypothetical protein U0Q18_28015 [Bryobacteraceae bacterium]
MRNQIPLICAAAVLLHCAHAASAPAFGVSPSNLYLVALVNSAPPHPQVLVINNVVANTTLKWKATISGSGASYCAVSPSQGSLSGPAGALLTVSAQVPSKGGSYACNVNLADNGSTPKATNSPTVSVSYAVFGSNPPAPDTTPPYPPQYLGAVAAGPGAVNFTWYGSGDPNSFVAGFRVYRDGTPIAVTGLTSYQDSGLAPGSYHTYTVTAFDSAQNMSAAAPHIGVTVFLPAATNVPAMYTGLYQGLVSNITTDLQLINAQWTGAKYGVNYAATLKSANQNAGVRTYYTNLSGVDQELDGLQNMGINAVMVTVGFPLLDQNFYQYLGQTATQAQQTVQNYLTFYQLVAQDIHSRKDVYGKPLRMIVEANPMLTVDGASADQDPTRYYQSLSFATYQQRRSANTVTIAQSIQPDYLIVQSEPDTDARDDYRPELNTPATNVAMVQQIVNDLTNAHISGLHTTIKLGAGMGAWQTNWQDYLGTPGTATGILGITGLDGIDNHLYYLTGQAASGMASELDVSMQMIDAAHAAGKFASIAEYWPHKSLIVGENSNDVRTRDTFDFMSAIDQQFIPVMFKLANEKSLEYLSAFNDSLFWAYEPYASIPCVPVYPATGSQNASCDNQILNAAANVSQQALTSGQLSSLGKAFKAEITSYRIPH